MEANTASPASFFVEFYGYRHLRWLGCYQAIIGMEEYEVRRGVYERNIENGEYNQEIR